MSTTLFAANWKMQVGPGEAAEFMNAFLAGYEAAAHREIWFFPPAVSIAAVAQACGDRDDLRVGAQDIHWEPKGAFTGALSIPLVSDAGATAALVGHSERRHVFGESDQNTGRKVSALLDAGLTPVLCVGERLEEREAGHTLDVVRRQLGAGLAGLDGGALRQVIIAYEPVWAIGTGLSATPADAAAVHSAIRVWLRDRDHDQARILYGGSVKPENSASLLVEHEIDGVLVGGASLEAETWLAIARTERGHVS